LRYLENFEFRLVKEALKERQWWIQQAPHLTQPLKLYIPIYQKNRRPAWIYKIGLWLYDWLAGEKKIGKHQSLSQEQIRKACPELKSENLIKGFSYYDAQMDDFQLGLWALNQAKSSGDLEIREHTEVAKLGLSGIVYLSDGQKLFFDEVINIAGPWAEQLLAKSGIKARYKLDLVRGSHVIVDREVDHGYFLEVPNERRIFFVLPYQGMMLIGTTEERQSLNQPVIASQDEIEYLINAYNHYFENQLSLCDVVKTFSGLRPLICSSKDTSKVTREYAIQKNKNVTTVFGGKWTTARCLATKVCSISNFGKFV
jgi:glycerol-3-phosphate dehydrogenase